MEDHPHNKLRPDEAERLAMLTEEAGEIAKASCDIFELLASGRLVSTPKMSELELECLDFKAVTRMMHDDISAVYGQLPSDMIMFYGSSTMQEQLAILAAAASRVVQIACKTLRHGYDSFHPDNPTRNNRALLALEVEILTRTINEFSQNHELKAMRDLDEIISKKLKYTHHQICEN